MNRRSFMEIVGAALVTKVPDFETDKAYRYKALRDVTDFSFKVYREDRIVHAKGDGHPIRLYSFIQDALDQAAHIDIPILVRAETKATFVVLDDPHWTFYVEWEGDIYTNGDFWGYCVKVIEVPATQPTDWRIE